MKTILLNPGPVTLSNRVRNALLKPDLCHRESEFSDLQQGIRDKLLQVYKSKRNTWVPVLLTGSGTAGVEAMISSCVSEGDQLLVIENGAYGERISSIAQSYNLRFDRLSFDWGGQVDIETLRNVLAKGIHQKIAVVHHETTTGRLNDLEAIANVCLEMGTGMLIDAVSSFGAENMNFDDWPIIACSASANKCLHGVPGAAFVIIDRKSLPVLNRPRSLYLNLASYLTSQEQGGTPFTQSIQTFYALDEALSEFLEQGGQKARKELFETRLARIRLSLSELGIQPFLTGPEKSCVLEAFELPDSPSYVVMHDFLKEQGFIIYAGQGRLSEKIFRLSAMGDIEADDLERLCKSFRMLFQQ